MWQRITEAAERHNTPGAFTAFIGYEWTSGPGGNNLHRNVIFRDGKDLADQVVPFSAYDSEDPEDLWDWMERYETETGGQVLAIPHNGNLSNGLMFDDVTMAGEPLSADYATRRMRWEPVYEVTQMKGDGEAHPMLSPDDAFADYGTWDVGSFGAELKTPEMLPREYAREAYKRGLAYDAELGANPFKFGMVGSTDSHTGLATTTEDNFFGKVTITEPTADPIRFEELITGRATPDDPSDDITHAQVLASGLAAVWAKENTREAIWDALSRKEVYATTGTRLRVRVFAGTSFSEDDLARSDFAAHGYANGVPMGGDLTGLGSDDVPGLLIRALRDPDGANLDRVQVIKGWLDAEGACRSGSTTWPAPMAGRSSRAPATVRWAIRSTWPAQASRTRSETRSSRPIGRIRISIRRSAPSTTCASSRSRRRAGRPTMPPSSGSTCRTPCRPPIRNAPTPRRSGIRPRCANPASRRAAAHASTSRRRPSTDRYEGSKAGSRMRTISSSPVISSRP
jgi:hypothetical protein